MEPFHIHTGTAVPLDRADVDTDQIIPAEHLKRIERSGFGPFLFGAWREDPDFVLNRPEHRGASILLAGPNFGCGSSREHAVWALQDAGFRIVVAPSFGDIFRTNCTKVGLLPVRLPEPVVRTLMEAVDRDPATPITVDLEALRVTAPGVDQAFQMDDFTRRRLLEGLDDVGLTLRHEEQIADYEATRSPWLPTAPAS
ncbi:MAG TPA: 3-isopropylmalate dehydratase small subunit [Actinomycetota bacterium]|jgi:3-isopropylmalate/(R)-2-methylmalate dehydratase small subunit|nr:3-isopropylmalate dehydratase small subunit [Actinomycetota bacterium]